MRWGMDKIGLGQVHVPNYMIDKPDCPICYFKHITENQLREGEKVN